MDYFWIDRTTLPWWNPIEHGLVSPPTPEEVQAMMLALLKQMDTGTLGDTDE